MVPPLESHNSRRDHTAGAERQYRAMDGAVPNRDTEGANRRDYSLRRDRRYRFALSTVFACNNVRYRQEQILSTRARPVRPSPPSSESSSVANASCGTVSIAVSALRILLLVERDSRSEAAPVPGRPYPTIRDVIDTQLPLSQY